MLPHFTGSGRSWMIWEPKKTNGKSAPALWLKAFNIMVGEMDEWEVGLLQGEDQLCLKRDTQRQLSHPPQETHFSTLYSQFEFSYAHHPEHTLHFWTAQNI